tara:strand:- start:538 stop:1413 length:876 start_codon:yes stop_codon:yes gene_type:complete
MDISTVKKTVGVIIIGFKYMDRQIQSTLYDIYRVYDFFKKLGYTCYVLTDLVDFRFDKNIYNTILKNQVGQQLLNFIDEIKKNPPWYKYTYDFRTLKNNVQELPSFDLGIAYYSGHGRKRGIELPAGDILNYAGFKTLISEKVKLELVMIMDCCHVHNMGLQYQHESVYLDDKMKSIFRYIGDSDVKNTEYINPTVFILASSDINEKSAANRYASLFTKYLLEYLSMNEQRSYHSMIEFIRGHIAGHDINNKQSVKIYSSISTISAVPSYLFGNYYIKIDDVHKYIKYEKL